jgi:predicted transcriptional regulator
MAKMIRISELTSKQIDELAQMLGLSKKSILEKAVARMMREEFFKKTNKEYAILKANPQLWQQELSEIKEWDTTLKDGLDDQ